MMIYRIVWEPIFACKKNNIHVKWLHIRNLLNVTWCLKLFGIFGNSCTNHGELRYIRGWECNTLSCTNQRYLRYIRSWTFPIPSLLLSWEQFFFLTSNHTFLHIFYVECCFEGVARNGWSLLVACEGSNFLKIITVTYDLYIIQHRIKFCIQWYVKHKGWFWTLTRN